MDIKTISQRKVFMLLMGTLVALAWLTLWIWEQSSYGRYLHHGQWDQIGLAASICRSLPAGNILFPSLLYVGGWTLMSAAMMLPTAFPLLEIFRRLSMRRPSRNTLMVLLIFGYLTIWGLFGLMAHMVDYGLYEIVKRSSWLTFNGWIVGAAVIGFAGLFQFSALKYRCLDKCRTPMSFVIEHWQGKNEKWQAFLLGTHHGIFCVGCCWALMLLMFVIGTGSVGWMFLLGAVMAAEKNLPWGWRLSYPLGVILIAWSGMIIVRESGFLMGWLPPSA